MVSPMPGGAIFSSREPILAFAPALNPRRRKCGERFGSGGNSASASAGTPARRRAGFGTHSFAARRGRLPRRFGQAVGALRCRQSLRRWLARQMSSYGSQNRPPALTARPRSLHARAEIPRALRRARAREPAGCLRMAFASRQGTRSAAVRASYWRASRWQSPRRRLDRSSAISRRPELRRPARARSTPAEIPRGLRVARPRGGGLLA